MTAREISDAIDSAFHGPLTATSPRCGSVGAATVAPTDDYGAATGWPAEMPLPRVRPSRERIARVLKAAGNFELVDLWSDSPVCPPEYQAPQYILGQLFNAADLLCVGSSASDFAARTVGEWTDVELCTQQFVVPNPLRKLAGTTKTGGESAHSRDATGPRRFVIVESDAGLTIDEQAKIVQFLRVRTSLPLAAVVMSGGKSLHAWFRCAGVTTDYLRRWFEIAVSLGADPRLWLPEQFVRLPDGRRDNGARQSLMFLNPDSR